MELRIYPALHEAELRVFRPVPLILINRPLSACVGERPRRHNIISKQQQSRSNIFAVAVVVVALGRSLYFLSSPAAS